jgi:nitrite reductase/ring-hydroxylating ferredoxin subunit
MRTVTLRHVVDRVENLPPGRVRMLEIDGRAIAVLNVDGEFYAIRNRCPHHGAPLCGWHGGNEVLLTGTMTGPGPGNYEYERRRTVIRCPWHGFEYRLDSGHSLVEATRLRLKTFRVEIEDSEVVVYA